MKTFLFLFCLWFASQDGIVNSQNTTKRQQPVVKRYCGKYYHENSGVKVIKVPNYKDVVLYCDQDTDGGQWNVFQRRVNGLEIFTRRWFDYKDGFGNPKYEFWLGLETLHQMTKDGRKYELRFDLTARNRSQYYAVYDDFSIGSESEGYAVHFTGYRGNAGDEFSYHRGKKFSTIGMDQDEYEYGECATETAEGGWWFNNCHLVNLNGKYNFNARFNSKLITWRSVTGWTQSLLKTEMKFRALE